MIKIVLKFVHSHECAFKGQTATRECPVRLDGTVDVPRPVCADPNTDYFFCELEYVGIDYEDSSFTEVPV